MARNVTHQHSGLWDNEAVSKRLGDISVRTLDHWASTGKGPKYYRVGRYRMYDPADVEAWLEQQAVTPRS